MPPIDALTSDFDAPLHDQTRAWLELVGMTKGYIAEDSEPWQWASSDARDYWCKLNMAWHIKDGAWAKAGQVGGARELTQREREALDLLDSALASFRQ